MPSCPGLQDELGTALQNKLKSSGHLNDPEYGDTADTVAPGTVQKKSVVPIVI